MGAELRLPRGFQAVGMGRGFAPAFEAGQGSENVAPVKSLVAPSSVAGPADRPSSSPSRLLLAAFISSLRLVLRFRGPCLCAVLLGQAKRLILSS